MFQNYLVMPNYIQIHSWRQFHFLQQVLLDCSVVRRLVYIIPSKQCFGSITQIRRNKTALSSAVTLSWSYSFSRQMNQDNTSVGSFGILLIVLRKASPHNLSFAATLSFCSCSHFACDFLKFNSCSLSLISRLHFV